MTGMEVMRTRPDAVTSAPEACSTMAFASASMCSARSITWAAASVGRKQPSLRSNNFEPSAASTRNMRRATVVALTASRVLQARWLGDEQAPAHTGDHPNRFRASLQLLTAKTQISTQICIGYVQTVINRAYRESRNDN